MFDIESSEEIVNPDDIIPLITPKLPELAQPDPINQSSIKSETSNQTQ